MTLKRSNTVKPSRTHLVESAVIYHSREDECWIAHSLRTDQIGTGNRIVDALADLIRAVDQVRRVAKADRTVALHRDAPKDIQRLAKRAKPLPREIYEVAHRMVHNEWPTYIEPNFQAR